MVASTDTLVVTGPFYQQTSNRTVQGLNTSDGLNANGTVLPLDTGFNSDGTPLAAAPASTKVGLSLTLGTSVALTSETANNNTKTDVVAFRYVLPPSYNQGAPLQLRVNCQTTLGAGTVTTNTLAVAAYSTLAGAQTALTVTTASQTIPTAAAATLTYNFTPAASLTTGSVLYFKLTITLTETAASNVSAAINAIRIH